MLSKNAANFTVWLATFLWLGSFGLLVEQLFGGLRVGAAMYVTLGAVTATMVWLVDRAVDTVVARLANLRPRVMNAPGWDPQIGSRTTVAYRRPDVRYVSLPVPVPPMDADGETTRQILTTAKAKREPRDDAYWQAYSDLLNDIMSDPSEDQEH